MAAETPSLPETLDYGSFLETISQELADSLTPDEQLALPDMLAIATRLYESMEIKADLLDLRNPDAVTRASLTLALAYDWHQHQRSFSKMQDLSEQLLLLFSDQDRNYAEAEQILSGGTLHNATAKEILHAAFPSVDLPWDSLPYAELLTQLAAKIGENGVIRLPFNLQKTDPQTEAEAVKFLKSVYAENQISSDQQKFFSGFYNADSGTIVLWLDSPVQTEIHEQLHATNHGLLAGGLGHILNEGMTDMLTHLEMRQRGADDADIALIRSKSTYMRTVQVVEKLVAIHPQLGESLINLYHTDNLADAKLVSGELIKTLGLEKYAQLYTGLPRKQEEVAIMNLLESLERKTQIATSESTPNFVFDL